MATVANIKNNILGCFIAFAFHFRFCFGNRFVFGLPFMPLSQPCYPYTHFLVRSFELSSILLKLMLLLLLLWLSLLLLYSLCSLPFGKLLIYTHAHTTEADFGCIHLQSTVCMCKSVCDSDTGNIAKHRVFVHMYQCICQSHLGTESVVIDQHVNRISRHGPKEAMRGADSAANEKIL